MRIKLQFGGKTHGLQEYQFFSFPVPGGGVQLVELAGVDANVLVLSQGEVLLRKRIDYKTMRKRRGLVRKRPLLQEVLREVLVEFVQALLISGEPDVLLRNTRS